jgi:hypothetical protein
MQGHWASYQSWSYDAQCLFNDLHRDIGSKRGYWKSVNVFLTFFYYLPGTIVLFKPPLRLMEEWLVKKPSQVIEKSITKIRDQRSRVNGETFAGIPTKNLYYPSSHGSSKLVQWVQIILITLFTSSVANFAINTFWLGFVIQGSFSDRNIPRSLIGGNGDATSGRQNS